MKIPIPVGVPDHRNRVQALVRSATPNREPLKAEITAETDANVAVLRLYDPIDSYGGVWGVSAKEFAAAVDALPATVTEIRLHVNSPGGDVFEGLAILNTLRAHDARVTVVVDGIAASAASFIAMGADEVIMARNSEMMIHEAAGIVFGNAGDMRKMSDLLDHLSDNIASIYAEKAGGTAEEWRAAMSAETWYSAAEAVTAGLADSVDDKREVVQNSADLAALFRYNGRANAPAPGEGQPEDRAPEGARQKFGEHANAVLAAVTELTDRAAEVVALRAEKGKALAPESAELLTGLTEQTQRLVVLLTPSTDPDTADEAAREYARFVSITRRTS